MQRIFRKYSQWKIAPKQGFRSQKLARVAREDLFGPVTSTIHKMYVVLFPKYAIFGETPIKS